MSLNHSDKPAPVIKCPECKAPGLIIHDENYEWRCRACETVGPEFDHSW